MLHHSTLNAKGEETMNEKKVKELIKYIKSSNWIVWSCGRNTDYIDKFWEKGSIENLINKVKELLSVNAKTQKTKEIKDG